AASGAVRAIARNPRNSVFRMAPSPINGGKQLSSSSLCARNRRKQGVLRRLGSHEQIGGQLVDVPQHVGVDRVGLIQVKTESRQVLQAQIAVAVDGGVA